MNKTRKYLRTAQSFLRKNWFIFFTVAAYLFFTIYYMGLSTTVLDCGNTLNSLGDNSAGPIWKTANVGDEPIGGFSKVTNYPEGESLSSPIDTVVVGQSLLLWTTAKIAGPVCGYNIANVLGYMSSALVMFAFIYSLTRGRRWIALLAGYAVAFTPFFQTKIGGHPSYGFQALLIGIIWAFLSLVATRKKSRAVVLAVLVATCFYFDPYFSLMAFTILVPLGLVWLSMRLVKLRKEKTKKHFFAEMKVLGLCIALLAAFIAPLAYIMTTQSSVINSATAGTRDNILVEARVYSNMPTEYLLPFRDSPIFKVLGSYQQQVKDALYTFSNGNYSEDTVGLSLVMVAVIALFMIIITWEKLQRRRLNIGKLIRYDPRLVVFGVIAVGVTGIIMALPPVHIFGVPLPSYILLAITSTWRVLSREYVVVNIATTILFVVALLYFTRTLQLKRIGKAVAYSLLFLFIFIQYQTYRPFQGLEFANFSYSNAPAGYYWLRDQKDIKAIAEYPIQKATESNAHGYYMSMHLVHKKPLLNSAIANGPGEGVRSSIKNLSDPQTVPVLHSLGIDAIVTHGVDAADIAKIPYLSVVYTGVHGVDAGVPGSSAIAKDLLVVARIAENTPAPLASLQFIDNQPANSVIQTSVIDWQYEVPTGTKLALRRLPPKKEGAVMQGQVCFMARIAGEGESGTLSIIEAEKVKVEVLLTDQYRLVTFKTDTGKELKLVSSNGHNMRISKIGCM